jgi:hypothetical protein
MNTPNSATPAAVDALRNTADSLDAHGWHEPAMQIRAAVAALARPAPPAVDEALRKAAKDVVEIASAARFALLCPSELSESGWDFARMNDDLHGALHRLQSALHPHGQEAATPAREGGEDEHVRRQVGRLAKWLACLSYNESYVGEPAGEFKSAIRELSKAVDPIYPPDRDPKRDPPVTVHGVHVAIDGTQTPFTRTIGGRNGADD